MATRQGVTHGPDIRGWRRSDEVQREVASTADQTSRSLPFQVRGSLQTVLALRLLEPDDPEFLTKLVEKIAYAPDFYRDAPIVLDLAAVTDREPIDLVRFAEELRRHRLVPVGVQHAGPAWLEEAERAGLAVFAAGGPGGAAQSGRGVQPPRGARRPASAMVVTEPVRGGQQLVAHEGDLVVLAPVGHGAEIAAAGHIHVYAPLRGRAYAGIEGDESAMIFCDQLDAELVSIAGVYVVNEEIDTTLLGKRVRISCMGDRLHLAPMS